jgi:hypothetical protein
MKLLFDITAGRIVIEGDGPDLIKVLESARELAPHISQIQLTTGSHEPQRQSDADRNSTRSGSNGQSAIPQTMRQFARSLALDNAAERIAALGYYANKVEGKPSFSPKQIDGWFTMCGFQKPSQIGLALYDTKRKYGYSENVGRGAWRISNQGENLIIRKIEERDTRAAPPG